MSIDNFNKIDENIFQDEEKITGKEKELINCNVEDDSKSIDGKFTFYLGYCLIVAVFGSSFQYGYNIGVYNTPYLVIRDFFNNVYKERYNESMPNSTFTSLWSVTNGLMPLGGIFGSLTTGLIADQFGRKNGLLYCNILVIVSLLINVSSVFFRTYETMIANRFITGFFSGIFTGIIPLYLFELPPRNLRGFCGALNQLSIVLGILTSNILGLPFLLGTSKLWPVLISLVFLPCLVHLIGLPFAVESPKFLYINSRKEDEAKNVLIKLRGKKNIHLIDAEVDELEAEKSRANFEKRLTFKDFWTRKSLKRPLIIAVTLKIAQHFSGINAVVFYSTKIFTNVGLKGDWPIYATLLLSVVQVVMTSVCMFLIDKVGRRVLLVSGCVGMSIFSFTLAISRIYGMPGREWLYALTVIAAVGYFVCYSMSLGPLSWIIVTEIFESEARGKANSIATFFNWSANFLITVSFPFIEAAINSYSFVVYGFLLILISLFSLFFVPETKNRATSEIVEEFNERIFVFPKGNRIQDMSQKNPTLLANSKW